MQLNETEIKTLQKIEKLNENKKQRFIIFITCLFMMCGTLLLIMKMFMNQIEKVSMADQTTLSLSIIFTLLVFYGALIGFFISNYFIQKHNNTVMSIILKLTKEIEKS